MTITEHYLLLCFIQNKHQDTLKYVPGSTNIYKIAREVTPTNTFVKAKSIIEKRIGVEEVPRAFSRELAADESLVIDVTEEATDGFVIWTDKVQDDANWEKSGAGITNTEQSPSLRQLKNLGIDKWAHPQTEIHLDHGARLHQETHNSALTDTSSITSAIAEGVYFQSQPRLGHHKGQHQEASNESRDWTLVDTSSVLFAIVKQANPQSTSSIDHHAESLPAEDVSSTVSSLAKFNQANPQFKPHLNRHRRWLQTKNADSTSSASTIAMAEQTPMGIAHEMTPAPVPASRMHSITATSVLNPSFKTEHPQISKQHKGNTTPKVASSNKVTRMVESNQCFSSKAELKQAVDKYVTQDCANLPDCAVGQIYGWPMNSQMSRTCHTCSIICTTSTKISVAGTSQM